MVELFQHTAPKKDDRFNSGRQQQPFLGTGSFVTFLLDFESTRNGFNKQQKKNVLHLRKQWEIKLINKQKNVGIKENFCE